MRLHQLGPPASASTAHSIALAQHATALPPPHAAGTVGTAAAQARGDRIVLPVQARSLPSDIPPASQGVHAPAQSHVLYSTGGPYSGGLPAPPDIAAAAAPAGAPSVPPAEWSLLADASALGRGAAASLLERKREHLHAAAAVAPRILAQLDPTAIADAAYQGGLTARFEGLDQMRAHAAAANATATEFDPAMQLALRQFLRLSASAHAPVGAPLVTGVEAARSAGASAVFAYPLAQWPGAGVLTVPVPVPVSAVSSGGMHSSSSHSGAQGSGAESAAVPRDDPLAYAQRISVPAAAAAAAQAPTPAAAAVGAYVLPAETSAYTTEPANMSFASAFNRSAYAPASVAAPAFAEEQRHQEVRGAAAEAHGIAEEAAATEAADDEDHGEELLSRSEYYLVPPTGPSASEPSGHASSQEAQQQPAGEPVAEYSAASAVETDADMDADMDPVALSSTGHAGPTAANGDRSDGNTAAATAPSSPNQGEDPMASTQAAHSAMAAAATTTLPRGGSAAAASASSGNKPATPPASLSPAAALAAQLIAAQMRRTEQQLLSHLTSLEDRLAGLEETGRVLSRTAGRGTVGATGAGVAAPVSSSAVASGSDPAVAASEATARTASANTSAVVLASARDFMDQQVRTPSAAAVGLGSSPAVRRTLTGSRLEPYALSPTRIPAPATPSRSDPSQAAQPSTAARSAYPPAGPSHAASTSSTSPPSPASSSRIPRLNGTSPTSSPAGARLLSAGGSSNTATSPALREMARRAFSTAAAIKVDAEARAEEQQRERRLEEEAEQKEIEQIHSERQMRRRLDAASATYESKESYDNNEEELEEPEERRDQISDRRYSLATDGYESDPAFAAALQRRRAQMADSPPVTSSRPLERDPPSASFSMDEIMRRNAETQGLLAKGRVLLNRS
jgi:hypothetical protein